MSSERICHIGWRAGVAFASIRPVLDVSTYLKRVAAAYGIQSRPDRQVLRDYYARGFRAYQHGLVRAYSSRGNRA